ncbi:retrovirus-related pol polyprotein from transposon TNT 1-94 [Tanacetum coccineum]
MVTIQTSYGTRQRIHTDSKVCMYALTISTIKPKNIKEAMADHSWIESMQDELNHLRDFKFGNLFHDQKERILLLLNGSRRISVMLKISWFETKLVLWQKDTGGTNGIDFEESILLKKALYGLKQAPRTWYDKLSSFLIEHGFTKDFSKRFANLMKNNSEMLMMGELKFFLGLQVHQSPRGHIHKRLDVDLQGNPTDQTTYRRMIGGLMYLTASRPDIAFATFVCARYQARPTVKYLKEMRTMQDVKKYIRRIAISRWKALIWMRTQLLDYGYKYNRIPMYCDSKSAIAISCNPVQHSKTKHTDIRYHFIKEHVGKGTVELYFVGTEYQLADLFTKALPKERFIIYYDLVIAASFSVPMALYGTVLDTLKEDGNNLSLPQAKSQTIMTTLAHPPIILRHWFYSIRHLLGFTNGVEGTSSSFKTTGLLQPWQTLCKIFSKCLTTQYYRKLSILSSSNIINSISKDLQRSYLVITWIVSIEFQGHLLDGHREKNEEHTEQYRNVTEGREYVELGQQATCASREEIKKMMEGLENVIDDSLPPRNDEPKIPGTRLEPRSDKESPEVEITNDEEEEEGRRKPRGGKEMEGKGKEEGRGEEKRNQRREEKGWKRERRRGGLSYLNKGGGGGGGKKGRITDEVYELKRREKRKIIEESRSTPFPTPIRSPRIHSDLVSSDTEKLQELTVTDTKTTPSSRSPSTNLSKTNQLLSLFKAKPARFKRYKNFFQDIQGRYTYLFEHLKARFLSRKSFDTLADHLQEVMVKSLPTMVDTHIKEQVKKQIPEQMKFENLQVNENEQGPSTLGNQEQEDDYDFWTESYASDDDEIPTKQMSQDIMEEVSLTIDEAKLKKMVDEMLIQRCTSGDEHQYHINQMKNFLKSNITTPLVQSCQRDPEAPALSLINQDLLYLEKGSSGLKKIVLSLYKFLAIIFNDDDIEEQTSRWENKCIIQVIKTYWELSHEHKFIREIVARRANECIVSIIEPDHKNLNKNDINDMYLLIMNGKVPDYAETGLLRSLSVFIRSSVIWERVYDFQLGIESYQQKVNLTAPTISFPGVEKHKMFSIIYEPVHGIIYKNSKKEKRVMRHSEIHKFCDATLNRVLEGLKSYNNDVKYGYVQRELTNDEVEYLKLFEEEIEVRFKYRY